MPRLHCRSYLVVPIFDGWRWQLLFVVYDKLASHCLTNPLVIGHNVAVLIDPAGVFGAYDCVCLAIRIEERCEEPM